MAFNQRIAGGITQTAAARAGRIAGESRTRYRKTPACMQDATAAEGADAGCRVTGNHAVRHGHRVIDRAGDNASASDCRSLFSASDGYTRNREIEVRQKIRVHFDNAIIWLSLLNDRRGCSSARDDRIVGPDVEIPDRVIAGKTFHSAAGNI